MCCVAFAILHGQRRCSAFRLAKRRLTELLAAMTLAFLKSPPGNHLARLTRDREGSSAFASISSGEFALFGRQRGLVMLKLLITTDSLCHGGQYD